jgi:hypothetical protein
MTNRTISWIGLIPMLLWLIPLQAKKASPELFGGPLFQWTAGAVNAVLIPVLVLMGLKLLATQNRKRAGLGLLFSAGFPMVALLLTYGVFSPLLARTRFMLANGDHVLFDRLPALVEVARDHEDPAKRKQAARALHVISGITTVWRNEAGEFEIYEPNGEDLEKWEDSSESKRTAEAAMKTIDGQLRQMPWLFAMNLGTFVIITGAGLLWHVYHKPRVEPAAGTE